MMGIGFPELMIILVIIMIIFGAGKLPEIGSAFGRSIKNFKTSMRDAEEAEKEEASAEVESAPDPKAVSENSESIEPEPAAEPAATQETTEKS